MKRVRYIGSELILLLVLTFCTSVVFARQQTAIRLDVDHAAFAYGEDQSLVEIYMAFDASTLPFYSDSVGYIASLPVGVVVRRSTQATLEGTPELTVWSDSLDLSFMIPDTTGIREGQQFIHQVRMIIPPGEYELLVDVPEDKESGRMALQLRRDVLVSDYSDAAFVDISDVCLASNIERSSDRSNLFYKNGLLIRPNANQLYGSGLDRLYYYAEIYNSNQLETSSGKYSLLAYVAEANLPQPLPGLQRRFEHAERPQPDVLVGSFDMSTLPSGAYFLRLAVLNETNEAVAEQSRKFFVFNPDVKRDAPIAAASEAFETSQYAAMTEEEVDNSVKHVEVISTAAERKRFRSVKDLDERRRLLMEFWTKRDPNPSTPVNEFKDSFYSRVQYANDRYTTNYDEGWTTDRGRTLMKFGTPTAIEPHLYDRDTVPYEIWEYNNIPGEGRAIFVFADRDGFGLFELIHSTVTGERKLANWESELVKR